VWCAAVSTIRTCDDVELVDVGNLGAVAEGLAADAGVRERSTDGEVAIIRPRPWGKTLREGGVQHVYPQLLTAGVETGNGPEGRAREARSRAAMSRRGTKGRARPPFGRWLRQTCYRSRRTRVRWPLLRRGSARGCRGCGARLARRRPPASTRAHDYHSQWMQQPAGMVLCTKRVAMIIYL
jgi:hypothetical protein